MDELKKRILKDAELGDGDIIRVDMFLNHCMDVALLERVGRALAKRFRGEDHQGPHSGILRDCRRLLYGPGPGRSGGICQEVPDWLHRPLGLHRGGPLLLYGEVLYHPGLPAVSG